jgi:DNA-binding response OmpR family regulator/predicted TPR repeat methyltransferase
MREIERLVNDMDRFKVLIVDDKANMRRTIRNMLRVIGFSDFTEAEDGDVALKKIEATPHDFIICDWNMPRVNGLQVLKTVRVNPKYKDLAFLMVTAEVEEATVAESIEAKVDGYIVKPFVPKTLENKMTDILRRKMMPSPQEIIMQLVEEQMDNQQYQEALLGLEQAEALSPKSPRIHYLRGLIYLALEKLEDAEASLAASARFGPKFVQAHEKLAEIHEKKGDTDKMVRALKQAVRISPKNADRQTKLGEALLVEGKLEEAKKAFGNAARFDAFNAERRTAIGEAYLKAGRPMEAEDAFKASIKVDPRNIYVYNRLGMAFRRQKKYEEAISYYLKALQIAPQEEGLLYNLARVYWTTGQPDHALDAIKQALAIRPEFQEARTLRDKILAAQSD